MLTFFSRGTNKYCDGVSRRNFLKLGALGVGGLTFADLLRAEDLAGVGSSNKAIINIHLSGGPSHQDMFDLKPNAPVEYRGEFSPINTNVPGLDICQLFPKLATMGDKIAVIRSLTGMFNDHSNFHTQSGWGRRDLQNSGGRPSLGSVVAKIYGSSGGAPPFVSYNGGEPGYLGPVYKPFRPSGDSLKLNSTLTAERLDSRTNLLSSLDQFRRESDRSGQMDALDSYTQRAIEVVSSGRVADAIDLKKEDPRIVDRYTNDGRYFLTARRLVEAGVRVVTFNWGGWDTHSNNFGTFRKQLPKLDTAMSALIEDLHARGLEKDVTIVMWGEFGRTPRVNNNKGRDHWPQLAMCFLAGGGMRTGQAVGTSTKNAEQAKDRPVHLREVFATLYHNMGIDVGQKQFRDANGRPQYLVDGQKPIAELV